MHLRQDRTLARQLSGAFVLFGALVAGAFCLTALCFFLSWVWLAPEVERSRLAVRGESTAHAAMLDQEVGARGYLLTGNAQFAEPYTRGVVALARAHEQLATSAGAVRELSVAMVGTRLAEERWQERWARLAVVTEASTPVVSMSEGKALFDAYRIEQAAFAIALDVRRASLLRRESQLIGLRVAIELSAFIAVLFLAVRQHRALREAIVAPVAALLHHIRRIRDGYIEASADSDAPRELAELGEGLNEMVRALVAARELAASRDGSLREHSARLRQILEASHEFAESLNLKYVVGAVRQSTAAVGGYDRVIVWMMDDEQKRLVNSDESDAAAFLAPCIELGQGLAGRAAKSGRITFEGSDGLVRVGDGDLGLVRAIAMPLIVGARVVGALEARHVAAKVATKDVIEVLEMLSTHAATAIESARLHEVIEERSQMDALTRLFNRRRLDEDLNAECQRCARYDRPLAFVMLDVDHFKAFNDNHGHPKADAALQDVASVIAGCVRTTDTAYRYGGEEFCVLLRETSASDAMLFAERLRLRIEHRFASAGMPGITASFGVADLSADTPTARALVEAADAAMYESKTSGRNRVALSSRPPRSASLPPPSARSRLRA